jgi:predicted RNA polymerase sigma factor
VRIPALDGASQLALTLRLISGLTVDEIARALLHSEAAVGQRITRVKNKIRGANIPLRVPPAELLPHRVPHVPACISSVFTEGVLVAITDSPVARANRALAVGFRDGFDAGLSAVDEVTDDPRLARSAIVASIRADLLRRTGRYSEAAGWYRTALELDGSEPAREFLRRRLSECEGQ